MPLYWPLSPCVMSRVLMTSRGVVAKPVTAPASAPMTDVSAYFNSVLPLLPAFRLAYKQAETD